jgi:hypothetical protein
MSTEILCCFSVRCHPQVSGLREQVKLNTQIKQMERELAGMVVKL